MQPIRLINGGSNPELAASIADYLDCPLVDANVRRFSDGEVFVEIKENIRGDDCYVIQSTSTPANDNLMELLIIVDALKRASAGGITAVIPYYGYARQDRKVSPRTPISAKLVADLLDVAGVNRIVTVDLHAGQIQGYFNFPVDHLYAMPVLLEEMKTIAASSGLEPVIVSPDAGGTERARAYAERLGCGFAMIDKRRPKPNVAEIMNIVGEVSGKLAMMLDDMIDTGGTITQGAAAIKAQGAKRVIACATHAVLSGPALERIRDSELEQVIFTDTIPLTEAGRAVEKIKVVSVSDLLGEALRRIHEKSSVSSLFI